MNLLDWFLVVLVLAYALSGYWQGFITGAFATEEGRSLANFAKIADLYLPDILFTLLVIGLSTLLIAIFSLAIAGYLTLGRNPRAVALLRWLYRWPLFIPFIVTAQVLRAGRVQLESGMLRAGGAVPTLASATLRIGFFNAMELRVSQPYQLAGAAARTGEGVREVFETATRLALLSTKGRKKSGKCNIL